MEWLVLYVFLICATIWDCHSGRIPNCLVCIVLVIGGIYYGSSSCQELFFYFIRLIGFGLPFITLFYIGGLGGGDVKVIATIGGLVGVMAGINIVVVAFVMAAMISLVKMLQLHIFQERIQVLLQYIEDVYYVGKLMPYPSKKKDSRYRVRLSIFFLLGTILHNILYQ